MKSCSMCQCCIPVGQDICTSCWTTKQIKESNKITVEKNMYYFVLTSPESTGLNLSMYFTTYLDALEYSKSVEKNNPKIVEYNPNISNTMMYDNVIGYLKNIIK